MCETRAVEKTLYLSENLSHISFLACCLRAQHGIKGVLWVTKPLNILDEVQDTMHYRQKGERGVTPTD